MYVTGTTNDKIYEYTLTSAFDISTATYRGFLILMVILSA